MKSIKRAAWLVPVIVACAGAVSWARGVADEAKTAKSIAMRLSEQNRGEHAAIMEQLTKIREDIARLEGAK